LEAKRWENHQWANRGIDRKHFERPPRPKGQVGGPKPVRTASRVRTTPISVPPKGGGGGKKKQKTGRKVDTGHNETRQTAQQKNPGVIEKGGIRRGKRGGRNT